MKKLLLLTFSIFIFSGCTFNTQMEENNSLQEIINTPIPTPYPILGYAIAEENTPILYTPDFAKQFGGEDGKTLNFDDYGEIDALEHIAPKGSIFAIREKTKENIWRVTSQEYDFPSEKGHFVHAKFLGKILDIKPEEPIKEKFSQEKILENLKTTIGEDYVWGGNSFEGAEKLLKIFPPKSEISAEIKKQWALKGFDCSGLLYWATNGQTPRNTSKIINFGNIVNIEGKKAKEIISLLKPLDIIVWKGHMLIVFDDKNSIESAYQYGEHIDGEILNGGVRVRLLSESLEEVLEKRIPVNNYNNEKFSEEKRFVVRRFIEE